MNRMLFLSLCFIISMLMCDGIFAQSIDKKSSRHYVDPLPPLPPPPPREPDHINYIVYDKPLDAFAGVYTLQKTVSDNLGLERIIYPGTFMIIHPDSTYTIFDFNITGGDITSRGKVNVQSISLYTDEVTQHVDSSLVGTRIKVKKGVKANLLERFSNNVKDSTQQKEIWERAALPSPYANYTF